MPDLTARQFRWGLLAAYLLHLGILGLYIFDAIPQEFHRQGYPLWLHHGGDDYDYVALANNILDLNFAPSKYPLGFPLLLTPFMAVLGTRQHDELLQVVAGFWGIAMFPIGQAALAWIGEQMTGRRRTALLAVLLWTALPLAVYAAVRPFSHPHTAETASVHLTWAQMLSDGPAALFTLLLVAAWLRLRTSPRPARWAILLGGLAGGLMLIRFTGALTVGAVGLLLLIERRWRAAGLMVLVAGIVFLPQMVYNAHFFATPFTTGYTALDTVPPDGLFNLPYLADGLGRLWDKTGPLVLLGVGAGLGVAGWGLRSLWQYDRGAAGVVGLWIGAYLALYSVYYYSWTGSGPRLLIPAYPAAALLAACVLADTLGRLRGTQLRPKLDKKHTECQEGLR